MKTLAEKIKCDNNRAARFQESKRKEEEAASIWPHTGPRVCLHDIPHIMSPPQRRSSPRSCDAWALALPSDPGQHSDPSITIQ